MSGHVSLVVALLLTMTIGGASGSARSGAWLGGYRSGDEGQPVYLMFATEGDTLGMAAVPFERIGGTPILRAGGDRGDAFAIVAHGDTLTFEVGSDESLPAAGIVRRGADVWDFEMAPIHALPGDVRQRLEGSYLFEDGGRVHVSSVDIPLGPLGTVLFLVDAEGAFRLLFPLTDSTFAVGAGGIQPLPHEAILMLADGRIAWEESGRRRQGVQVLRPRREPVRLDRGEFELVGELLLPPGPGPHPCMVAVHGSGPQGRGALLYTALLLDHGYAVLGYDKRGVGESGGTWTTATLPDLADDALAAVDFARAHPDIRTDAIGLIGGSQGGWIVTLAASRSAEVAFIVSVSGAGVTPAEQELDRVRLEMTAEGYEEAEISAALDLYERLNRFVRTGEGWAELQAARRAAMGHPWIGELGAGIVYAPPAPDHWIVGFWRGMLDYDPMPAMAAVRCPVLALWGGIDPIVAAQKNKEVWDRALPDDTDYTGIIFPNANHMLWDARLGTLAELPRATHFAPGVLDTLVTWLDRHVGDDQRP